MADTDNTKEYLRAPILNIVNIRRTWRKAAGRPTFSKVEDSEIFLRLSQDLLERTEKSVLPMKKYFEKFQVTREEDTLKIEISRGLYLVEIDGESKSLFYLSPVSGRRTFVLNNQTNEWVNPEDGELFENKLVRDLSRQCDYSAFE